MANYLNLAEVVLFAPILIVEICGAQRLKKTKGQVIVKDVDL